MTISFSPNGTSTDIKHNGTTVATLDSTGITSGIADASIGVAKLALNASSIGVGQKYNDITASRAVATTYYNTSGKPIYVSGWVTNSSGAAEASLLVNGVAIQDLTPASTGSPKVSFFGIVPPGASYSVTQVGSTLTKWFELS